MENSSENKPRFSDPKNVAIALLVVIVLVMGLLLAKNNLPLTGAEKVLTKVSGGVSVVEVKFDAQDNTFVDIIFNKPVGKSEEGEILGRDPAVINPPVNGSWTWKTPNVLSFQASYRFNMATDYTITLKPENFLKPGESLGGKTEFEIRTDKFRIEQATVEEDPVPDQKNTVTLAGTLDFNYTVDPSVVARKISLIELPAEKGGEEKLIPVKLVTDYWNTTIKWSSDPIEKMAL